MKKQLETLKKIQDLSLTRAECTARGENAPVDALTKEISALAAMARSSQMISRYQERIIKMVPNLSQRTARSIMIGMENISYIDSKLSLSDALIITGSDFHTRYPVCEDNDINKILGYVNIKPAVIAFDPAREEPRIDQSENYLPEKPQRIAPISLDQTHRLNDEFHQIAAIQIAHHNIVALVGSNQQLLVVHKVTQQ